MQLAGWIGTTTVGNWPAWMGEWFSLFGNVQTIVAQVLALGIVVGSYFTAEYLRVWRPRRRGLQAATFGDEQPGAVMAEVCTTAETIAETAAVADAAMNARLAAAAEQPAADTATAQPEPSEPVRRDS
jgi:hypothetical protein